MEVYSSVPLLIGPENLVVTSIFYAYFIGAYSSSSQLQFYTDLKIHVISLAVEQKYFKT